MIYIIGVGIEGKSSLSPKVLKLIENASILIGGRRHLACFPEFKKKKVVIGSDLNKIIKVLTPHSSLLTPNYAVVLATGDPNFFGIADFLIKRFGKDKMEMIPNVSTMQEAFARIKDNWNDARFLSLHGRGKSSRQKKDTIKSAIDEIVRHNKIGIFTDPENTPSKIAKALLDKGAKNYRAYVCEDLGTKKENITEGALAQFLRKSFSPLNVMVLIRQGHGQEEKKSHASRITHHGTFGIPDSEFAHSGGMITKEEVRVISLSKLNLRHDSILWDIGAGCGSVSIEAALFAKTGTVFAIEKEKQRITYIEKNKAKFNVKNLEIVHKTAPDGLKGLPAPDTVFIGGGGKDIERIINKCSKELKRGGRIVVNAITIETLSTAVKSFKRAGLNTEIISVNIAKTKLVPRIKHVPANIKRGDGAGSTYLKEGVETGLNLFNALNPVFIIVGDKPHEPLAHKWA